MTSLTEHDALLIVDLQNDFLPGGALGVPGGDDVIPILREYVTRFQAHGVPIVGTRDWHPANHCSFRERGGIWPPHCIGGTPGADPPPTFSLPPTATIVLKGTTPDRDAYSGFDGTILDDHLRAAGIHRLFVGGFATDYCVLKTVQDALAKGYKVVLLVEAIRAVNLHPDDGIKAQEAMIRAGAVPLQDSKELF